jgi:hypothetical protein
MHGVAAEDQRSDQEHLPEYGIGEKEDDVSSLPLRAGGSVTRQVSRGIAARNTCSQKTITKAVAGRIKPTVTEPATKAAEPAPRTQPYSNRPEGGPAFPLAATSARASAKGDKGARVTESMTWASRMGPAS